MRYRKLSDTGDFVFGSGSDFFINEPAAVGQSVKTRLALFTGEWFLNVTEGTPWTKQVLGKYTSKAYDAVIKARILGTQGVQQILVYSSSVDAGTRALSINVTLKTIYGRVTVPGIVIAPPAGELYGGDEFGGYGGGGYGGPTGV